MILAGQRSFFELTVLAYQHPVTESALTGQNLLRTTVRYGWLEQQPSANEAVLSAQEINSLINWLKQLYATGQPRERLNFKQSSLGFECISASHNEFLIQVKLSADIAPDWYINPLSSFWLPVVISKKKLANAINQLVNQFIKFPVR